MDIKAPLVVRAHDVGVVARVRLRSTALSASLRTHVTLRTNVTDYVLPLLVYSGRLEVRHAHLCAGPDTAVASGRGGV